MLVCLGTVLSDIHATVTDPSGVEDQCDIAQDCPGVYQVLFKPRETGLHFISVNHHHSPVPGKSVCLYVSVQVMRLVSVFLVLLLFIMCIRLRWIHVN